MLVLSGLRHEALGVWYARFGGVDDAWPHLRESRRVVTRLRLQRDLLLCVLDGGGRPARVLGLGEALGEVTR